jgi:serine/threonine protein kinase
MLNRVIIDPLHLTPDTEAILANYLQGVSKECRISHRHQHYRRGQPVFKLSHDIVARQKTPGVWRFYVVDINDLGSGRYGAVFKRMGRLHFDPLKPERLVVKRYPEFSRLYKKQKYLSDKEYANMQHCPHLRTREFLAGYPNFISMRHFEGTDLFKIIEDDFNGVSILTRNMRYRMSVRLLRALQDQIADWMMLHRDIKPNNLIYNLVTGEAFIIDMGGSQVVGRYLDKRSNGNSRYSAPEVFTSSEHGRPITFNEYLAHAPTVNKSTVKSDIYSMALVVSLIWRNNDSILLGHSDGVKRRMQKRAHMKWRTNLNLFNGIDDGLLKEEMQVIASQLAAMTSVHPDDRPDLQQCIRMFDSLYLEDKLRDMPGDVAPIRHAHEVGMRCYDEMRRIKRAEALRRKIASIPDVVKLAHGGSLLDLLQVLSKKYLYKYSTLYHQLLTYANDYDVEHDITVSEFMTVLRDCGCDDRLRNCLVEAVNALDDDEGCIREFIETADVLCLQGFASKQKLLDQINVIFSDLKNNYHQISITFAEIKRDLKVEQKTLHPDKVRVQVLTKLVADLKYFFKNIQNKPMTVDWVYQVSQHCFRKSAKTDMVLQELAARDDEQAIKILHV